MNTENNPQTPATNQAVGKLRLAIGGFLFVGGFLSPLLIPLVVRSDLPGNWKAVLSTGLVAGLPEVGMVLAAAVLGRDGFALLKNKLFALLRKHTGPSAVSAARYRLGLVLFCVPLLAGWLGPYGARVLPALSLEHGSLAPAVALDLTFALSFLVLGADFWEKIRRLFVYDASSPDRG